MRENRPSSSMRGEARRSLAPASQSVRFAYSTHGAGDPDPRLVYRPVVANAFRTSWNTWSTVTERMHSASSRAVPRMPRPS